MKRNLIIIFALAFCFSCQPNSHSKITNNFLCKDYKLDVPIESVDAETTGKKSGDTHFHSHSTDTEVFYSYENFSTNEEAKNHLENWIKGFRVLIRKSLLKDDNNKEIGEKNLILTEGNRYYLYWTNGTMFSSVSSESLSAIEEIEKHCNL